MNVQDMVDLENDLAKRGNWYVVTMESRPGTYIVHIVDELLRPKGGHLSLNEIYITNYVVSVDLKLITKNVDGKVLLEHLPVVGPLDLLTTLKIHLTGRVGSWYSLEDLDPVDQEAHVDLVRQAARAASVRRTRLERHSAITVKEE